MQAYPKQGTTQSHDSICRNNPHFHAIPPYRSCRCGDYKMEMHPDALGRDRTVLPPKCAGTG